MMLCMTRVAGKIKFKRITLCFAGLCKGLNKNIKKKILELSFDTLKKITIAKG